MAKNHCLICYEDGVYSSAAAIDNGGLIAKQLELVFILRKLLDIPASSLEKYLVMSGGDNPECWMISLCGECGELVGKGRRIFEEMVSVWKRFKVVQEQVVEKVKASRCTESGRFGETLSQRSRRKARHVGGQDIGQIVTEESRTFVCAHHYDDSRDPFPAGDLEAERLLSLSITQMDKVKEERVFIKQELEAHPVPVTDGQQSDDEFGRDSIPDHLSEDDDWAPPSPPPVLIKTEKPSDNGHKGRRKKGKKEHKPRKRVRNTPRKTQKLIEVPGAFYRDDGKVNFRCPFPDCGQVYKHKRNYLLHKSRHTGEFRPVPCDICGKEVASHRHLKQHIRVVHEGKAKKQYMTEEKRLEIRMRYQRKCPHCDKVTDKYTLAKHIQVVHESVRTIFCEICGKDLGNKRLFREHQAEVHGICSVETCKATFTPGDREGMRNHQLEAHGREVDVFRCDDCGKLFMRINFLRGHEYQVHFKRQNREVQEGDPGAGEWVCHQCGKQFAKRAFLTSHVYSHRKTFLNRKHK